MRRFSYHGNFCAECGNPLAPRRSWLTRFLCDECAASLHRTQRLPRLNWPWLLLAVVFGLFYLLNHSTATTNTAPLPVTQLAQSANVMPVPTNAPANTSTNTTTSAPATGEPTFCGARTKRGTPCRRMVKAPNERCAQHRGKPSFLYVPRPQ